MTWEKRDIFQHANVMRLQHGRKIGQVTRGMPNGKDGGHDSILLDATAVIYNGWACIRFCSKPRTVTSPCLAGHGA